MMCVAFSRVFSTRTWEAIVAGVVMISVSVSDRTVATTLSPPSATLFAKAFSGEAGGIVIFSSMDCAGGKTTTLECPFSRTYGVVATPATED